MVAAVAALGLPLVVASPAAAAAETTNVRLDPLNGSGASGSAQLVLDESANTLTVNITAQGLVPNLPHAQHVHIGGQNVCPAPSADTDGDGIISTPEGQPSYGNIAISLTTTGDFSPESALAIDRFPVASAEGTISYERTFDLSQAMAELQLDDIVIVQHGIDTITPDGEYGPMPPSSPLDPNLPLEATAPAACGPVMLPQAADITPACQNVLPADSAFTDIEGNVHGDAIRCLAASGMTEGVTPTMFMPGEDVTREQVASFLVSSIEAAQALEATGVDVPELPAYDGTNAFTDVAADNVHVDAINRLEAVGIIEGVSAGMFNPGAPVTRAQAASLFNRTQDFLADPFATTNDFFGDDSDSAHQDNINAIASVGVTTGTGEGFNPGGAITRAQWASFLARHLAVNVNAGILMPLTPQ